MKIYFHSLAPVKKEIGAIRKLIKNHSGHSQPLQAIQDLVASFYGWTHYNQMSHAHEKMMKIPNLDLLDHEQLATYDISFINTVDGFTRSRIEVRKRRLLNDYLVRRNFDDHTKQLINTEAFIKRSLIERFISNFDKPELDSLYNIPEDSWRTHTAIFGNDVDRLSYLYGGVPMINAYKRGGFMLLRESVAKRVISEMKSSLDEYNQERLEYFYAGDPADFESNKLPNAKAFDPLATESFEVIADMFASSMSDGPDSIGRMWIGRAISLVKALFKIFEVLYKDKREQFTLDVFEKALTVEGLQELIVSNPSLDKNTITPLVKFLEGVPGFTWESFTTQTKLPDAGYEQIGYFVMQITPVIERFRTFFAHEGEKIHLQESLSGDKIVIGIIPNCLIKENPANCCLVSFRKMLLPQLGVSISSIEKGVIPSNRKQPKAFKPVILDNMSSYRGIDGIVIVAAQSRSLGYAFFYNISCIERSKYTQELEYCSALANSMHTFFVEYSEDNYKHFDNITTVYQSTVEFNHQFNSGYTRSAASVVDKNRLFNELANGNILYFPKQMNLLDSKHPVKTIKLK